MALKRFTAVIVKEDKWFVGHCLELGVASQGRTVKEAKANIREAVELYIESTEDEELPNSLEEVMIYSFELACQESSHKDTKKT